MDHPFIATLTRSGPVGQTILAGLLLLSIYTWTIVIWKARLLSREERACRAFLARFAEEVGRCAPLVDRPDNTRGRTNRSRWENGESRS